MALGEGPGRSEFDISDLSQPESHVHQHETRVHWMARVLEDAICDKFCAPIFTIKSEEAIASYGKSEYAHDPNRKIFCRRKCECVCSEEKRSDKQ